MKNRKKIKIAAYLRVSTKKQADSQLGIEAQERHINNWINYNYFKKEYDVQITYFKDEGISGSKIERPEFQKMLNLIVQKYFDVCVIYKIDRLSRDVGIASDFKEKIKTSNCSLVSISENFDLTTVEGTFVYNIQSVFGEHERELIRKRTVDSQISKLLRGEYPFRIIFGYQRIHNQITIKEDEAKIVQFIFQKFNQCKSIKATYDALLIIYNYECKYDKMMRILQRIEYTGKVEKSGVVYDNIFPELISESYYEKTQELIKSILKIKREDNYIFQNRVMCAKCNCYARKRSTIKRQSIRYYYYQCTKCKKYINITKIEEQVRTELILKDFFEHNQELEKNFKRKLRNFNLKKKQYSNLYVCDKLSVAEYHELMQAIHDKINFIKEELIKNNLPKYKIKNRYHQKIILEQYVDQIVVDFSYKTVLKINFIENKVQKK